MGRSPQHARENTGERDRTIEEERIFDKIELALNMPPNPNDNTAKK